MAPILIGRSAVVAMLACVAELAAPAAAKTSAWATVTLAMSEYRFAPAQLHFRRGTRYRLVLENPGKELHEFTAPIFLGEIAIANPEILVPGSRTSSCARVNARNCASSRRSAAASASPAPIMIGPE
jgi:uncharacterized cupredoxin-like copper-binding protein